MNPLYVIIRNKFEGENMPERDKKRKPYEKPAFIAEIEAPPHVLELLDVARTLRAEADRLERLALELAKAEAET